MRWEIYKQLKANEREYYKVRFTEEYRINYFFPMISLILACTLIISAAILKTADLPNISLMKAASWCFVFALFFLLFEHIIVFVYIIIREKNLKKWLKDLGHEYKR